MTKVSGEEIAAILAGANRRYNKGYAAADPVKRGDVRKASMCLPRPRRKLLLEALKR